MDDLISRQAAIEAIDAVFPVDPMKSEYAQGIACGAALAKTYVEQLPSAQPERKKGKWIYKNFVWFCSECDNSPTKGMGYVQGHDELYDFCPHCGADMRERKEE